jgi:hypothetical protein
MTREYTPLIYTLKGILPKKWAAKVVTNEGLPLRHFLRR